MPVVESFSRPIQVSNITGFESTLFLTNSISALFAKLTTFAPFKLKRFFMMLLYFIKSCSLFVEQSNLASPYERGILSKR